MLVPSVIMVGADKGGVGKTTVARALLDYLAHHSIPSRAFDTEFPTGDLVRFASATVIDITKVADQMKVFDGTTDAGVTVLDVRAGLLSPTIQALDDALLLQDVRNGDVKLMLLHVLGPTISSIGEIASAAERIGGGAVHLLVKNHINDTTFFEWDADQANSPLRSMADVTINVPQLPAIACEAVQKVGGSFVSFASDRSGRGRILTGNVQTWLRKVWAEFDRVRLLGLMGLAVASPAAAATTRAPAVSAPALAAPAAPSSSWFQG
jgi:hypothetical protein